VGRVRICGDVNDFETTSGPAADVPMGGAQRSSLWSVLGRDVPRGVRAGIETFWILARAMVPAYALALVLREIGAIDALAGVASPVMGLVGLPGGAAVPLVLGYVLNLYASVGALAALSLDPHQITVLALAVLIGHNFFVEGAVLRRAGMSAVVFGVARALAGLAAAGVANLIMNALK
jgi:hypothetical protein